MTTLHPHLRLRRLAGVLLFLGATLAVLGAFQSGARAVPQTVVLSGTLDADAFVVAVHPDDPAMLLLCAEFCFSRSPAEIGTIVVDGRDGDDTLLLHHNGSLATNTTGDLTISFSGGPGVDQLHACVPTSSPDPRYRALGACVDGVHADVRPGASVDERVLAHSTAAGKSVSVTMNDVATIDDRVRGTLAIAGNEVGNQVTYRAVAGSTPARGEVAVDLLAPYRFTGKDNLTLDTGAGPDTVQIATGAGVTGALPCDTAAPVCVRGGSGDDTLSLAGLPGDADRPALTSDGHASGRLTGMPGTPALDFAGIDRVELGLQSSADAFSLSTTPDDDTVRSTSTASGVVLTGDLATDTAAYPLPEVVLAGDGTAPLALELEAAGGDDRLEVTASAGDDAVRLGPTGAGTPCALALSACLQVTTGSGADHWMTLSHLESHAVEAGTGDDALDVVASLLPGTTWRGGEGADRVDVRGTGPRLTVDLASDTVTQDAAGGITATATEVLGVHASGGSVLTNATAADDDLTFRPDGSASGRLTRAGHPTVVELAVVGGSHVLNAGDGRDRVTLEGAAASDRFAVGRGTDLAVQIDALLPVRVSAAEEAVLRGHGGDDRFDLTGTGGPSTVTVDGGTDALADRVTFAAATTDAEVSIDDNLGTGQLSVGGPPVGLAGIEHVDVEGDGAHGLAVRGSDAAEALTQSGNTVRVGNNTDVVFSRFPRVTLDGGAAGDQLWLAPATTTGVADLTALGGGATDSLTVLGTTLSEQVTYTPTGADAGRFALTGSPTVTFAGIESSALDGATAPPSGDLLRVATPTHDGTLVLDPGSTFDSGTVRFLDLAGTSTTAAPLHFGRLGRGELELAGDPAAPADRVLVTGQPDDDLVAVSTRGTPAGDVAVVALDQQLPVAVPGAHTLVLDGLAGVDTFRLPTNHAVPGLSGPGIAIRGGGPDSDDRLQLTGGGGNVTVDLAGATVGETGHAAVHQTGVERITLAASAGAVQVTGGSGPDVIAWQPTGPAAGTVTSPGSPEVVLGGLGGLTLDPAGGADDVRVTLRTVADDVLVARAATTEVSAAGLQPVLLPTTVESLLVASGDGADRIRVTGAGGPDALAVDGGAPAAGGDVLRLEAQDVQVSYATDPTSGVLGSGGGDVGFAAVETIDVQGTGNGALVVHGTPGAEALTVGVGANPRIEVDEAAAVTYAGYPDLTLDGRAGDDDVTVGYDALGDVTTLRVDGGTGAGDRVTVVDTLGSTRTVTMRPQTATSGVVSASGITATLAVAGSELVALDGRGGDDTVRVVTPTGAQQVTLDPGTTADAGSVRVGSLLPLGFTQVGASGFLAVDDEAGERADAVVLRGSTASDSFLLDDASVRTAGWVPLLPRSALDLSVLGGDGDDRATMSGVLPYRSTTFDGGGPDRDDRLALQGPAGPVRVDLAAAAVSGYGGEVRFPGVADLHTDLGGQPLTQVGTARDDAVCYDPMAPRDGRLYILGAPGGGTVSSVCLPDQRGTNVLHTFVDVGHLTVDPGAGADEVIVNGTTSRDLVSIHALAPLTHVTVHPEPDSGSTYRLPLHVVVATTESLVVAADNGSDSFDVVAYDSSAPLMTLHGEGPSTMHDSDTLVFRDGTGRAQLANRNSHDKGAGTVTATYTKGSGAVIRADYDGIENVTLDRDPKLG